MTTTELEINQLKLEVNAQLKLEVNALHIQVEFLKQQLEMIRGNPRHSKFYEPIYPDPMYRG